jgi:hypothetical protein
VDQYRDLVLPFRNANDTLKSVSIGVVLTYILILAYFIAGVHELMEFLDHHKIPKAIVTRNSQAAIEFMKSKVNFNFSMEISR